MSQPAPMIPISRRALALMIDVKPRQPGTSRKAIRDRDRKREQYAQDPERIRCRNRISAKTPTQAERKRLIWRRGYWRNRKKIIGALRKKRRLASEAQQETRRESMRYANLPPEQLAKRRAYDERRNKDRQRARLFMRVLSDVIAQIVPITPPIAALDPGCPRAVLIARHGILFVVPSTNWRCTHERFKED